MKKLKFLLFIIVCLPSTSVWSQFTDEINSNRPGKTAGAFAVGKNVYQGEMGLFYITEKDPEADYKTSGFGTDLQLRAGVWREQFEITFDAQLQTDKFTSPYLEENRSGFRNLVLGAKYLFYDPYKKGKEKPNIYSWKANHRFKWKSLIPAISGYVGVGYSMNNAYNFTGKSFVSPKVMLITQNHFGTKWVLVTNIIVDKFTNSEALSYGMMGTMTHNLNDKWSLFGEFRAMKNDLYDDPVFTLGAAYLIKSNIQIDASISKNVQNEPDVLYGGIGFSYRFDKKHKDIKMKDGKEVKETKEEKENKSNIKSQEELDKIAAKANKKARKNKKKNEEQTPEEEGEQKPEEQKKKRLDQFDPNN